MKKKIFFKKKYIKTDNFLKEKFQNYKRFNKEQKIEKLIPKKNLKIEEIQKILNIDKKKILNSINLLNLKNKFFFNPNEIVLIADLLKIISRIDPAENKFNIKKNLINKNTIIISCIGEVDNGKSTLIQQICKKEFKKEKEITQNIEINLLNVDKDKILFLDTPGHKNLENFKKFSIEISNIIIIFLNPNEYIKPELIKLIKTIEDKNIFIIININKIDLFNEKITLLKINDLEKLKEKYRFNYIISKTSAKKIDGIENLINIIIKIKNNIKKLINEENYFEGLIIDNNLNNNSEIITTIFINSGNLKINDTILSKNNFGIIKKMFNFKNKNIENSENNIIIKIIAFKEKPSINEILIKIPNKNIGKIICKFRIYKNKMLNIQDNTLTQKEILGLCEITEKRIKLNLIIKSNSERILESIKNTIEKIETKNFKINFVLMSIGKIKISDVKLAKHTKSIIIAFCINIENKIKKLAKTNEVKIFLYNNIFDIIKYIKDKDYFSNNKKLRKDILAIAKINKIFNIDNKLIAGCVIILGKAILKSNIKIFRNKKEIFKGKIESLKLSKINVNEVEKDLECGIIIKNFKKYLINDIIKFYKL